MAGQSKIGQDNADGVLQGRGKDKRIGMMKQDTIRKDKVEANKQSRKGQGRDRTGQDRTG